MEVQAASDWRRRDPASVMEAITAAGIVAVLRASDASRFERVAKVLVEAGVTCVEFTLTSRGAVKALRRFEACMPAGITLGAGTVLEPETADAAIDAGASYLVSPTVGLDVIERARRRGVAALPGAFTPTEILRAWRAGADAVKLFPASVGGPAYLRAVKAPLAEVPLVPTGGVGLEEIGRYLDVGALAVGLSGLLVGDAGKRGPLGAAAARQGGRRPSRRGSRAMTGGGVLAGPSSAGRAWCR
jgi:2-dehydro-3-deoxyphosphogluconate aldolase / (4S)-4-hydroxy-2-oxoglutarate aldolase